MKKISILLALVFSLPIHAQELLTSFEEYKNSLQSGSSSTPNAPVTDGVATSEVISNEKSNECKETDQTSIPLKYLTSLILVKDGSLEVSYGRGQMKVSTPDMISNCSSMVKLEIRKEMIDGKNAYVVEAKIKQGEACTAAGCNYSVKVVKDGVFNEDESKKPKVFKPTFKGFEECLKQTGVSVGGKVVAKSIYPGRLSEKASMGESGDLKFVSRGPISPLIKGKYGDMVQDGCNYFETAHPKIARLKSLNEEQSEARAKLAEELILKGKKTDCSFDEMNELVKFVEENGGENSDVHKVLESLLLKMAAKSATKILEGKDKYTDEDLRVMQTFNKLVVQPKIKKAAQLHEEMLELEGDAKKAKKDELIKLQAELLALSKAPFNGSHTLKLISHGKFDDATELEKMNLTLKAYQKLGAPNGKGTVTVDVAEKQIKDGVAIFEAQLVAEKETYGIKTGEITGNAQRNRDLAARMRQNIDNRTRNYNQEITMEMSRVTPPNGHCLKPHLSYKAASCLAESCGDAFLQTGQCTGGEVGRMRAELAFFNDVDAKRETEFLAKAAEFETLESEGRRHVATQNGEEVQDPTTTERDTTVPTTRQRDNTVYNFDFQQQSPGQQQAPFMPGQTQNPMNPWMTQNMFQQNQYSPYQYNNNQFSMMGGFQQQQMPPYYGGQQQQMYGQMPFGNQQPTNGYSFNWGGNQQQQTPGYYPQGMPNAMNYGVRPLW